MNYYLTDSIFIKEGETFYENEKNIKKINKSNWHKYLDDYGWSKLCLGWKKRLKFSLSISSAIKGKINSFVVVGKTVLLIIKSFGPNVGS